MRRFLFAVLAALGLCALGGVAHATDICSSHNGLVTCYIDTGRTDGSGNEIYAPETSLKTLPLGTGAATSAKQDTGNTSLASIASAVTGVATAANQTTANTSLATIATQVTAAAASLAAVDPNSTATVRSENQYPVGAVPVSCTSGVVSAATATCTLPATSGKTTYLTGFDITGGGATAASLVTCTVTNTNSATLSVVVGVVAGVTLPISGLSRDFAMPVAATATNTSPVASCPTFGSGNTAAVINARGYEL